MSKRPCEPYQRSNNNIVIIPTVNFYHNPGTPEPKKLKLDDTAPEIITANPIPQQNSSLKDNFGKNNNTEDIQNPQSLGGKIRTEPTIKNTLSPKKAQVASSETGSLEKVPVSAAPSDISNDAEINAFGNGDPPMKEGSWASNFMTSMGVQQKKPIHINLVTKKIENKTTKIPIKEPLRQTQSQTRAVDDTGKTGVLNDGKSRIATKHTISKIPPVQDNTEKQSKQTIPAKTFMLMTSPKDQSKAIVSKAPIYNDCNIVNVAKNCSYPGCCYISKEHMTQASSPLGVRLNYLPSYTRSMENCLPQPTFQMHTYPKYPENYAAIRNIETTVRQAPPVPLAVGPNYSNVPIVSCSTSVYPNYCNSHPPQHSPSYTTAQNQTDFLQSPAPLSIYPNYADLRNCDKNYGTEKRFTSTYKIPKLSSRCLSDSDSERLPRKSTESHHSVTGNRKYSEIGSVVENHRSSEDDFQKLHNKTKTKKIEKEKENQRKVASKDSKTKHRRKLLETMDACENVKKDDHQKNQEISRNIKKHSGHSVRINNYKIDQKRQTSKSSSSSPKSKTSTKTKRDKYSEDIDEKYKTKISTTSKSSSPKRKTSTKTKHHKYSDKVEGKNKTKITSKTSKIESNMSTQKKEPIKNTKMSANDNKTALKSVIKKMSYNKALSILKHKEKKDPQGLELILKGMKPNQVEDLRKKLSHKTLSEYFERKAKLIHNRKDKPKDEERQHLRITVPNETNEKKTISDDEQKKSSSSRKKIKDKKQKKVKLVINIQYQDDTSSEESKNDEEKDSDTTSDTSDLSFLDNFNIDEIVSCLKSSREGTPASDFNEPAVDVGERDINFPIYDCPDTLNIKEVAKVNIKPDTNPIKPDNNLIKPDTNLIKPDTNLIKPDTNFNIIEETDFIKTESNDELQEIERYLALELMNRPEGNGKPLDDPDRSLQDSIFSSNETLVLSKSIDENLDPIIDDKENNCQLEIDTISVTINQENPIHSTLRVKTLTEINSDINIGKDVNAGEEIPKTVMDSHNSNTETVIIEHNTELRKEIVVDLTDELEPNSQICKPNVKSIIDTITSVENKTDTRVQKTKCTTEVIDLTTSQIGKPDKKIHVQTKTCALKTKCAQTITQVIDLSIDDNGYKEPSQTNVKKSATQTFKNKVDNDNKDLDILDISSEEDVEIVENVSCALRPSSFINQDKPAETNKDITNTGKSVDNKTECGSAAVFLQNISSKDNTCIPNKTGGIISEKLTTDIFDNASNPSLKEKKDGKHTCDIGSINAVHIRESSSKDNMYLAKKIDGTILVKVETETFNESRNLSHKEEHTGKTACNTTGFRSSININESTLKDSKYLAKQTHGKISVKIDTKILEKSKGQLNELSQKEGNTGETTCDKTDSINIVHIKETTSKYSKYPAKKTDGIVSVKMDTETFDESIKQSNEKENTGKTICDKTGSINVVNLKETSSKDSKYLEKKTDAIISVKMETVCNKSCTRNLSQKEENVDKTTEDNMYVPKKNDGMSSVKSETKTLDKLSEQSCKEKNIVKTTTCDTTVSLNAVCIKERSSKENNMYLSNETDTLISAKVKSETLNTPSIRSLKEDDTATSRMEVTEMKNAEDSQQEKKEKIRIPIVFEPDEHVSQKSKHEHYRKIEFKNMLAQDKVVALQLRKRMSDVTEKAFVVTDFIRKGRYSKIYQCTDVKGTNYAVKIISDQRNRYRLGIEKEKMLMEIQTDIPKQNLNFVYIINSFSFGNQWCFLMEYCSQNLLQVLHESGTSLHIDMVQKLSRQLVSAVTVLRNNKIVHSDINQAHILVNSAGMLKLCGFDNAYYHDHMQLRSQLSAPRYRAPEIILGYSAGYSIDVWATAIVMYEMATNQSIVPDSCYSNNEILYIIQCTLGYMPRDMIEHSLYAQRHFEGFKFRRTSMRKTVEPDFFGSNRIHETMIEAYHRDWYSRTEATEVKSELQKLLQLEKLLEQMLVLHPKERLPIEFVYANPFILCLKK